ncbi:MAG: hypothetical protein L6Q81_12035 [Bacteroidia bacterium]|nr:hypothetical protein [Bacteroidia bacterium]
MSEQEKDQSVPEPVFQLSENFSSAYFGKLPDAVTGEHASANDQKLISNFIALLIDPAHRDLKSDVLAILRNAKADQFLVDLLQMDQYRKVRRELIMACWESGLDFTKHSAFFCSIVASPESSNEEILEAITVIEEMAGELTEEEINTGRNILTSVPESAALYPLIRSIGRFS